ncbi:hypothetical protein CHLRE_06g306079v5 [Chlamydomonas reinhardtii]|uniref:Uncharacterized protein n=1 Tax=Chlamydomonas reinhardtii TaxID=3055 RepID=A0A2K3DRH8_CHLRE|nr:uncharacterized protein CHLRE_06g306079v5 [Chlamydomonas reinhardtii]PNW83088.1 hypothetical protein CHLRE_06g306079v5 [Chlamydomonas reinhardtii]
MERGSRTRQPCWRVTHPGAWLGFDSLPVASDFRAGPPYNYLLTLAQLPTATLPPVRLRGIGVPYTN